MGQSQEDAMQQMMHQFAVFLQQQHTTQQKIILEDRIRKARQAVTEKMGRFDGRDISKYCKAYEEAMEDNDIDDAEAVENFYLNAESELRVRIREIRVQHGLDWRNFKTGLKADYFVLL